MPTIPTFVSKKELTTEPGAVIVPAEHYGIKGDQGKILQATGETLSKIGTKFQEIQDENEFTTAQVNTQKRLNDIYTKVQADPDIWKAGDKAQEEIQKIWDEESGRIGNQLVKNKFMADFELRAMSYTNKINDDLRQRQYESMSATALDFIGGEKENYYNAGTPADRAMALDNIQIKINEMTGRGIWNAEKAQKFREDLKTEMKTGKVNREIAKETATTTKDSYIYNELIKGKNGDYSDLDDLQREDAVKKIRTKINDNKQYGIEIKVDNRLDILKQLADGKINWEDSDLIRKIAIDDPELGEAITKGTDTLFIPDLKDDAFVESVKNVFSASTKEEIATFIMNTLNENGNKEIGRERLAILTNAAVERAKTLKASSESQPVTEDPKQNEIGSIVKSLILISNPMVSIPYLIINFFKSLTSGKSPKDAYDESIKSEINRTNPLSLKYKIGDPITNSRGESTTVVGFNENGSPILKNPRFKRK